MDDNTQGYDERVHGSVVVEYVDTFDPSYRYRLTANGFVLRSVKRDPWAPYYAVDTASMAEQVTSLRTSHVYAVEVDKWEGPNVDLLAPRSRRATAAGQREGYTETDEAERKPVELVPAGPPERTGDSVVETPEQGVNMAEKESKEVRIGARAGRAITELKLDDAGVERARALATARVLPSGKNDNMVRLWDVYEAAGAEMSAAITAEKSHFLEHGKMARAASTPKEPRNPKEPVSEDNPPAEPAQVGGGAPEDETL